MSLELLEVILKFVLVFVFGLAIGSFISCFVWRKNNNMRLTNTRSQCTFCGHKLFWWENIPLFSYFFLKRKCSKCKKSIPAHYFLVELFTGILFLFSYITIIQFIAFNWLYLVRELIILSVLIIIFISDALYRLIWPSVVWTGLFLVLLINLLLKVEIWPMALGALIGGGFFLIQFLISKGRWIGGGDVRMGVMMGVWLGYPLILPALFLAYIFGSLVGVILLILKRKKMKSSIAFGPFLVMATFLTHYFQEEILFFLKVIF